jgi:hypothetical protein
VKRHRGLAFLAKPWLSPHDEELAEYAGEGLDPPAHLRPGHQSRHRIPVRRTKRLLKRARRAGRPMAAYSPSGHRRSLQAGPVPLPFRHRRRRW